MAEVIGAISSILAILDATKAVYKKVQDASRLPGAFKQIETQIALVWNILSEAEAQYKQGPATDAVDILETLKACHKDAEDLKKLYEIVCEHADSNWLHRYKRHISDLAHDRPRKVEELWRHILKTVQVLTAYHIFQHLPTPGAKLDAAIEEMEDVEDSLLEDNSSYTFNAPVASVHSGSGQNHSLTQQNLGGTNFQGGTHHHERQGLTEMEQCEKDLLDGMTSYRNDLYDKSKRAEGSCKWILSEANFQNWNHSTGPSLLSIVGPPGIGKSAIAAFLAECFAAKKSSGHRLAHFFCKSTDSKRNTAICVLKVLLFQLIQGSKDLHRHVLGGPDGYRLRGSACFQNMDVLWHAFESVLEDKNLGHTTIIIDGLDEIDDALPTEQRSRLIERLSHYFQQRLTRPPPTHRAQHVKFIFAYQPIHKINCLISPELLHKHRVTVTPNKVERDLTVFIDETFDIISSKWTRQLSHEARRHLTLNTGGTFLWVSLALRHLKRLSLRLDAETEVRQQLKDFPKDLDGVYKRVLQEADECNADCTQIILDLVVGSQQRFTEIQLATLLCFRPPKQHRKSLPSNDEILAAKNLLKACDMLLDVDGGENGGSVRALHSTIGDFLASDKLPPELSRYRFDETRARRYLSEALQAYGTTKELQELEADAKRMNDWFRDRVVRFKEDWNRQFEQRIRNPQARSSSTDPWEPFFRNDFTPAPAWEAVTSLQLSLFDNAHGRILDKPAFAPLTANLPTLCDSRPNNRLPSTLGVADVKFMGVYRVLEWTGGRHPRGADPQYETVPELLLGDLSLIRAQIE